MPSKMGSKMDFSKDIIKMKAHYNGDILITRLGASMSYDELCEEVREMCRLRQEQPITLKWIDDEGDPCTISSQMELEEAFRLYTIYKEEGLSIHVFPSIPEKPGMPCPGEDTGRKESVNVVCSFWIRLTCQTCCMAVTSPSVEWHNLLRKCYCVSTCFSLIM